MAPLHEWYEYFLRSLKGGSGAGDYIEGMMCACIGGGGHRDIIFCKPGLVTRHDMVGTEPGMLALAF